MEISIQLEPYNSSPLELLNEINEKIRALFKDHKVKKYELFIADPADPETAIILHGEGE